MRGRTAELIVPGMCRQSTDLLLSLLSGQCFAPGVALVWIDTAGE